MDPVVPALISAVIGLFIIIAFFGMNKNLRKIRFVLDAILKSKKSDPKAYAYTIIFTEHFIKLIKIR